MRYIEADQAQKGVKEAARGVGFQKDRVPKKGNVVVVHLDHDEDDGKDGQIDLERQKARLEFPERIQDQRQHLGDDHRQVGH
mmetsp:Transcript_8922/g.26535  ORF Transcript_8922/g.26535 Transcript_8922/m.26535 type:complete len:82 (-) Transcript_8922:534-779(-)